MANNPDRTLEVSESWLAKLVEIAEKVSGQINDLEPEHFNAVAMRTDIHQLTGYASSAATIIKYRRIADAKE